MKKLTIAYFGTPYFSAMFLEKLLKDTLPVQVSFVVTRPDKPVGRKQQVIPSPVKQIAKKYKIEVFEFENLKIENSLEIKNLKLKIKACDFVFLYAYGGIIPDDLLRLPRLGFLNTHPSLLPKYRGPSPIVYPLLSGDKETGVTLIKLDEEVDHGPILMQEKLEILSNDRRPDLEIKLTDLSYELFKKLIKKIEINQLNFREQDHKEATFTKMFEKKDGHIAFPILQKAMKNSPEKIFNLFRGLYPWPGIWTTVRIKNQKKRLKIIDVEVKEEKLVIKKVQLEGKNEVDFKTFQSAYKVFTA